MIAVSADSAAELLRWRDTDHHATAECAEVVGPDDDGKIRLNLVAGGKKTQVEVRAEDVRNFIGWRDRTWQRMAERD